MFRFRHSAAERSSSFGFFLFSCLIFSLPSFGPTAQGATYTLVVDSLAYPYLSATATDILGTSEFSTVFTSTAYLLNLPMILR